MGFWRALHHGAGSGGRVIYQEQGGVDIIEMRRAILANLENETYVGHPAYWEAK